MWTHEGKIKYFDVSKIELVKADNTRAKLCRPVSFKKMLKSKLN
jgi:hypothetical protein